MSVLLIIILIAINLIPIFIAVSRKHKDVGGIAAVTLLLGWTFIGWLIAFIWSLSTPKVKQEIGYNYKYTCAECGYQLRSEGKLKKFVCPNCGHIAESFNTLKSDKK